MRKYIIGAIFGIALTLASSAFADDVKSLVGKAIQGEFPVKINGEQLDKSAIVIDGTSYLPNRAIADALGMDISFNADLGIELKKKEDIVQMETTQPETVTPEPTPIPDTNKPLTLKELNEKIDSLNKNILVSEMYTKIGNEATKEKYQKLLTQQQADLADLEQQKAALSQ